MRCVVSSTKKWPEQHAKLFKYNMPEKIMPPHVRTQAIFAPSSSKDLGRGSEDGGAAAVTSVPSKTLSALPVSLPYLCLLCKAVVGLSSQPSLKGRQAHACSLFSGSHIAYPGNGPHSALHHHATSITRASYYGPSTHTALPAHRRCCCCSSRR